MPQYKAPLRDIRFVLYDLLDVEKHYAKLPGGADLNAELIDSLLGEAAKMIEGVVAPLNRSGDEEGCTWTPEGVTTPKGFKEAYKQYCDAGFVALSADPDYGGQGLPPSLGLCVSEMLASANNSFCMYPGLSNGAIACIRAHGTPEQKQAYLPNLVTGKWSGTMCLTEAHCGTDLGLLRTKASPNADGSFNITGEKIFISAGEHDMAENIIHLVLARLPDAPPGTKGISLFIVPKFMPTAGGGIGARNEVKCGSIEHKMGIKASATCVMVFEEAKGFLVGQPHKGLRAMFTMMNVARIGTGMQGFAQGEASFQGALAYARDRLQMRSLTGPKAPDKPADPIIVHPDVRRMLLTQKCIAEGSRALAYYCGTLADVVHMMPGTQEAKDSEAMLELLTPICKGFMTDLGFESSNLGMQVLGGHGYIREHGMEQLARDGRILQQYEGANGIQALDLLGRKVLATGGASLRLFTNIIDEFCTKHESKPELTPFTAELRKLSVEWHELVGNILQKAIQNPDEAGAASYDFMSYCGYAVFAFIYARMAGIAVKKLAQGTPEADFYKAKLHMAHFYYQRFLPRTRGLVHTMVSGSSNLMDIEDAHFAF